MKRLKKTVLVMLCATLVCSQGCMSIWKKDDFSSLTQPIDYQLEAPEPTEPDGVLGKVKTATGKVLGAGFFLLATLVLGGDDDCDSDRDRKDQAIIIDP